MSIAKRARRAEVRAAARERDGHRCRVCAITIGDVMKDGATCIELDAHHITPRVLMPNGGTVLENIITLCTLCHINAEDWLGGAEGECDQAYSPSVLYTLIGSTYLRAVLASESLA